MSPKTALLTPEPEFDWLAAEVEMEEFLSSPEVDPAVRPEVIEELSEAGWFDTPAPDWTGALCASHPDPDLWHPTSTKYGEKYELQQRAIATCQPCPIRTTCRKYGVQHMKEGVWGGIALDPAKDPSEPDPRRLATHCKRGHSDWTIRGRQRACRVCDKARAATRRAKKKEAQNAAA